ncbi:uncharacterized protein KY384_000796 [Bacidia gigantensis]|uniref:uncharacterized protein n=1 Tax=Bacidia gigantensis TaxID=2732470 RepID=UPI001D052118|nr:uncharacterized protein KY384_000796 [Bacidia gigantensis]KAG8526034.1 hypothetical protein KY384_000796 [Bacidia gigantensis]
MPSPSVQSTRKGGLSLGEGIGVGVGVAAGWKGYPGELVERPSTTMSNNDRSVEPSHIQFARNLVGG